MLKLNPEYIKIAVMPKEKGRSNAIRSSSTSEAISQQVIGISMSRLGLVSRTAQGVLGTVSYGCLGEPQAPGQIHVKELKTIIILRKHVVYIEMSSISAYN